MYMSMHFSWDIMTFVSLFPCDMCILIVCALFVFVLCLVCSMLSMSLDCSFLISPSAFYNVYLMFSFPYCYSPISGTTGVKWVKGIWPHKWLQSSKNSTKLEKINRILEFLRLTIYLIWKYSRFAPFSHKMINLKSRINIETQAKFTKITHWKILKI